MLFSKVHFAHVVIVFFNIFFLIQKLFFYFFIIDQRWNSSVRDADYESTV